MIKGIRRSKINQGIIYIYIWSFVISIDYCVFVKKLSWLKIREKRFNSLCLLKFNKICLKQAWFERITLVRSRDRMEKCYQWNYYYLRPLLLLSVIQLRTLLCYVSIFCFDKFCGHASYYHFVELQCYLMLLH